MVQTEKEKNNPIKNLDELSKINEQADFGKLLEKLAKSKGSLLKFIDKIDAVIKTKSAQKASEKKEPVIEKAEKPEKTEKIEKQEGNKAEVKAKEPEVKETVKPVKTEPKPQKPSTPKFEFRPFSEQKNDRQNRQDKNGQSSRQNDRGDRLQKGDKNFSRGDRPDRNDKNNQPRGDKMPRGDKPFGQRFQKDGQRPNKDGKGFDNKKPMPNKKPYDGGSFIPEPVIVKEPERQFGNKNKTHQKSQDKKALSVRQQMRMGIIDNNVDEDRQIFRRVKTKKKEEEKVAPVQQEITHAVITTENLTVKILSEAMGKPAADIVKKLFILGMICNINSPIDYETAELVASDMNITLEKKVAETFEEKLRSEIEKESDKDSKFMQKRPPIVTVMGHVDHGKTSLLDAIRKTNVIASEAGGITQHIGAYSVKTPGGEVITFLDTPGHEAFTAMRERGAQVTDIAILIVAADDGVMPQTKESIRIIKESGIPMVVAINKIDKPGANIPKLMSQLAENDVILTDWGGDIMAVQISAKKGENIDELLETIALVADDMDLKANPNAKASGVVIESRLDKGLGPVATVIIKNGTLKVGDSVASGTTCGKIRALLDENGKKIKKAGPSTPVSVFGLDAVPDAGDKMNVIDEKMLKQLVKERTSKKREELIVSKKVTADTMFSKDTRTKVLSLIIKADVQGSAQAIKDAALKIENEEVRIEVLSAEVGAVTENDLLYATTSQNTMILCFNQKVNPKAKIIAERDKIVINNYSIIYELLDDVEKKAKSMMDPKYKEVPIGKAEVRAVFNLSSSGIIAGSYVLEGKIQRNCKCRVYRKKNLMAETDVVGLKNRKEDVKEIGTQFECGIKLGGFDGVQEGDIIEAYVLERIN